MLSELFDMVNTKSIAQKDIVPDSGRIPYVTASASNNGVMTTISCQNTWLEKGNCIMIGGKTLTFTYQEKDFCSNDSHNIALYLKDDRYATRSHYLFLIAALRASLRQRYSWGHSISMQRIRHESVYLPSTNDDPDYTFMERFISELESARMQDLSTYLSSNGLKEYKLTSEESEIIGGGKHLFLDKRILLSFDFRSYPTGTTPQKRGSVPGGYSVRYVRNDKRRRGELCIESRRPVS